MGYNKKQFTTPTRVWSTVAAVAMALSLALVPIQAQDTPPGLPPIPQVEFGACGPMDVVFILDNTGSMGGAIGNIKGALSESGGIIETIIQAAGDDGVAAPDDVEAQLGLVVVAGTSEPTIDGQEYDCLIPDLDDPKVPDDGGLLDDAQYGSGLGDCIIVVRDLGETEIGPDMSSIELVETAIGSLPDAVSGGGVAEITAEALRTVLEGLDQTTDVSGGPAPDALSPVALDPGPYGPEESVWPRLQWNNWNGMFRGGAQKVVFLITDNVPGGTDSRYNYLGSTVDADLAAKMAADYATAGIIIQPVLVALQARCSGGAGVVDGLPVDGRAVDELKDDTYEITSVECAGGGGSVIAEHHDPTAEAIMQAYADATGGTLLKVPFNGEGTAVGIVSIIENCGEVEEEKEGRMTGGGSIFNEDNRRSDRTTHGFTLHCDGGPNRLQVNWPGNRFHLEELEDAVCTDNPELDEQNPVAGFDTMRGTGFGRLNGVSGAKVEFEFVDDGEPGKVSDTAVIKITPPGGGDPVLDTTGTLQQGNHQAHPEN